MVRVLLALVGVLFVVAESRVVAGPDWTEVAKRAGQSVVFITSSASDGCTGLVIDNTKHKYVLTAAHCDAAPEKRLWVDRVVGQPIAKDFKKDLLVVEVPNLDSSLPALPLAASDPEIQQDVLSIGYGYALERFLTRRAAISNGGIMIPEDGIGGPFFVIDAPFVEGQSGGPVLNANGEVVMIVQRATGKVGIGVGASVLREVVGRFWGTTLAAK